MRAIILAGGKGTRLAPYTTILPKPLMPIGEMPILEVILMQLRRAGFKEITLTVGHLASLMRAFFQDGTQYGVNIQYSYEKEPLGTAGPLTLITELTSTFLVANGDILTDLDFNELYQFHQKQGGIITIAMHQRFVKIDLGVIHCDGNFIVTGYEEKPTLDYRVSMGIYIFEPQALRYIPTGRHLDFPELITTLLAAGEKVVGFPYDGYWQDLGRPDDYEQATQDFKRLRKQFLPED